MEGELAQIFREAEGREPVPGAKFLDARFSAAEFLKPRSGITVFHIASHFDSKPGDASQSRMLLGDGTVMNLRELSAQGRLFEDVDLLTLSACQTGAQQQEGVDGREVDSLANVGTQLGAKAALASLWSVQDESTALFMAEFYRIRRTNEGITKSEALQRVQAAMIEGRIKPGPQEKANKRLGQSSDYSAADRFSADPSRPYAHPYYWAPFVLMGNFK